MRTDDTVPAHALDPDHPHAGRDLDGSAGVLVEPSADEVPADGPEAAGGTTDADPVAPPSAAWTCDGAHRARTWMGRVEPYLVGDPGRAGTSLLVRPDPELPYRPDTVLDGFSVTEGDRVLAEVRAASARGRSHRGIGRTRQDEYAVRRTTDGRHLVAVVADGVGAGAQSHLAATVAAQRGADLLCGWLGERAARDLPWPTLVTQLADDILALGRRLWERSGGDPAAPPSDREVMATLATTGMFAVVGLDTGADGLPVHLFQAGDSSAWVLRDGACWEPQQAVKNEGADIASNRVHALPGTAAAFGSPTTATLGPSDVLVLVSDGIGDPLIDGRNDLGDFLAECWAAPPPPLAFAAQVDFARRTFDDDRTAVAVWPGPPR